MASEQQVSTQEIQVREVTHYQFSWTEGRGFTLQLILDQGSEERVLALSADDADVIKDLLHAEERVFFDLARGVLMFGVGSTR